MAPQPDLRSREEIRAHTLARELAAFSARAGHDLLGPLNQASSLVALFAHRNRSGPDAEAGALLDFLTASAARMNHVIAGVQRFLDIAAGPSAVEPVDLNAALGVARVRLESAIAETGAAIIHEDMLPVITANGDQMITLFEILIGNSIKFRDPSEAPYIRIRASRSGEDRSGEEWTIAVEDNGMGIEAEYRESVFLPFRRLQGKEYPGAGMGLAAAKLIVGLHGGDIRVAENAEAARGTRMVFTLPA